MRYTILGASGFIGSHLKTYLEAQSYECFCPEKNHVFSKNENLGHVFYCIGLTSDFRQKPMETVRAHVCKLMDVLENSNYESFLYLSSTRVYSGSNTGKENESISVNPQDFSDLYNISKLMGESICLSLPNSKVRVVRLSNVIGKDFNSDNFLFSLIKESVDKNKITLGLPLKAAKDYVKIEDVVKIITLISQNGTQRIYNVASGIQISNEQIVNNIKKYVNCEVESVQQTELLKFPQISIEKIKSEFNFQSKTILEDLEELILDYKQNKV
jgi:nucleoside-diphosphate-sugar epimerase